MSVKQFLIDRVSLKWSKAVYRRFIAEPVWSIGLLLLLVAAYFMAQRLDPNAGISKADIWATAVLMLVGVLKVIVLTFTASWCKDKYTKDLSDADEEILLDRVSAQGNGLWVLILDRLEWAFWLGFCWLVVLH
jgi:hypothetical protein